VGRMGNPSHDLSHFASLIILAGTSWPLLRLPCATPPSGIDCGCVGRESLCRIPERCRGKVGLLFRVGVIEGPEQAADGLALAAVVREPTTSRRKKGAGA
jgi:hypothetical protein